MLCLSFCLQGVQLLFSQILQYIPKLRKELQLGQVRLHSCVIASLRNSQMPPFRPRTPACDPQEHVLDLKSSAF